MSGQQIGQVVGAAVGVLLAPSTAGASLLWAANGMAIGGAIGGLLMPDQVGLQDQAGPRLNDLKVSSTTYGASITRVFGAYRIGGNLIWALPIQETKHVEEQEVGKGGGSESYDVITYTYSVSFAIALCEGPIDGVRRIWADSALIYDFGADASVDTLEASSKLNNMMTLYKGDENQPIDWLIQASEPDTPAYRNVAYIVFNNLQLASYGDRIPNITVEVVKAGVSSASFYEIMEFRSSYYASPIQGKKRPDNPTATLVKDWLTTEGYGGTNNDVGHFIMSSYYNRGEEGKSIYHNGGWYNNNVVKFDFYGKNINSAEFHSENLNYYAIIRDKVKTDAGIPYPFYAYTLEEPTLDLTNGDTIVALNYSQAAYGAIHSNSYVDEKDIVIRNCSYIAQSIGWQVFSVQGIGDWYGDRYHYGLSDTNFHLVRIIDSVMFAFNYSYPGQNSKMMVYKKEPYLLWTQPIDTDILVIKPHVMKVTGSGTVLTYEGGEDILVRTTDIGKSYVIDMVIYESRMFFLAWETVPATNRLEIVVTDLLGNYIETIEFMDKINFSGTFYQYTDNLIYINMSRYYKIQVDESGIVLILNSFENGAYRYKFYDLRGDVTTTGYNYTSFDIGTILQYDVPIGNIYGVNVGDYMQYCTSYNRHLNTFKILWRWNEYIFYFDIMSSSTISLSSIVTELLLSSGIEQINIDTTDGLSVEVDGFVIENVSNARSAIATLQSIYLFDLVEENFVIKLKLRKNSTVVANIEEDDLILNNSVEIKKQLDTELPKKITVSYANNKRDYLKGTQSTIRIDGNSDHNINHDLPIAFTDDEAKNLVEQLMYSAWAQKTKANFNLPLDVNINISDLVTLNYDGIIYTLRVMSITYEKTEMQCVCIGENINNYSTFAIAQDTTEGFTDSDVYLAGDSFLSVFNSPTLSNTLLDAFGIHYAASGIDPWKGASIIKSNDLGQTYYSVDAILANVPLGNAYSLGSGPTTVWDLTNTLRLRCVNGDKLMSLTEAQVLSGENYMIVGSEVIQFKNVTPQADGDYIIDTLLRGRRGTEWAVDSHEPKESFIFLTNDIEFSFSTINIERSYKAVTFGTYPDDAIEIKQTYDGTNLKPFAPVSLELNGDIITWVRRDRYISGYLRTLPNSEQQEKYKVELFELGISVFSVEVDNDTTYTYDSITYPNIDTIQVSQYSDNLMDYGYIAEILV